MIMSMTFAMERETASELIEEDRLMNDNDKCFVVTLDGPAASGKSSVAQQVAEALNLPFVSSGLLYRAATLLVLKHRLLPEDEAAVLALLGKHRVELIARTTGSNRILVDGQDVSAQLHTDDVDANVSVVSRHDAVRDWVYKRLREIKGSFVIEGRDMGTVVFPEARHKFYLTASAEVRAKRRVGERAAGLRQITEALKRRDQLDAKQLAPASDALKIDTTELTAEQVVAKVLKQIRTAVN